MLRLGVAGLRRRARSRPSNARFGRLPRRSRRTRRSGAGTGRPGRPHRGYPRYEGLGRPARRPPGHPRAPAVPMFAVIHRHNLRSLQRLVRHCDLAQARLGRPVRLDGSVSRAVDSSRHGSELSVSRSAYVAIPPSDALLYPGPLKSRKGGNRLMADRSVPCLNRRPPRTERCVPRRSGPRSPSGQSGGQRPAIASTPFAPSSTRVRLGVRVCLRQVPFAGARRTLDRLASRWRDSWRAARDIDLQIAD